MPRPPGTPSGSVWRRISRGVRPRDWRFAVWGKAAELDLTAGRHRLRWSSTGPEAPAEEQHRVHLDGFLLSDRPGFALATLPDIPPLAPGEHRILLEAENESLRQGGGSQMTFMTFPLRDKGSQDRFFFTHESPRAAWRQPRQAEVAMFPTQGWFSAITYLEGIDPCGLCTDRNGRPQPLLRGRIRGREARTPITADNRFCLMNIEEELDAPGEWSLDYGSGRSTMSSKKATTAASSTSARGPSTALPRP
ncbi:MAG: hypothetical protein JXR77_05275 [Lentisphaeria bacterium]|nr:hypothetical protein [Lentisphaeria bacterium]